ncbi:MAG: hypothetical protein CL666_00530 [Balneola sp.]|nr:hypothetical protein [Balneola sp.]|tara:strand:- start:45782 stop:46261 length:480 start_codon:yes stop_codon:yes gene_type:complete
MNLSKLFLMISVIAGFLLLTPDTAKAQVNGQGGDVGLGVMLGEPTGISAKIWNNERSAFALGAAWSFGRYDAIHLHGDYILHSWFSEVEQGSLAFYYGIGARLALGDPDTHIGVRVPLGLNYIVPDSQIGLFVEAVPVLDLTPSTDFDGNGALGIRYYF